MRQNLIFKRFVTFTFWGVLALGTIHLWQTIALLTSFQISQLWTDLLFFYLRLIGAVTWSLVWFWFAVEMWHYHIRQTAPPTWLPWAIGLYTAYQLIYITIGPATTGKSAWITILIIGIVTVGIYYLLINRYLAVGQDE